MQVPIDTELQQALQNYQNEVAGRLEICRQASETEIGAVDRFEAFCYESLTPALDEFTRALGPYGLSGSVTSFKRDSGKSGEKSASLSYQFQPEPVLHRQPAYPKVVFHCFGSSVSVMFQGFSIVFDPQYDPQPLHEDIPDRHERRGGEEFTTVDQLTVEWCLDAVRRAIVLALPKA